MTVRINKQKINLREKLAGVEDKVNFDEVVRGLGEYTGNVGIGTTLTIKNDGNVGIGTTNPISPLHIKVGTDNNFEIYEAEATGTLRLITFNDARDENVPIEFAASKFNFLTGNVGIGTTNPDVKLEVKALTPVIRSTYSTSNDYLQFFHNGSNAYIDFSADDLIVRGPGNANFMRIDSTGNVGIGDTSPGIRLYVPNFYQYGSSNNGSAKLGDIRFDITGTMAEGLRYFGSGAWEAEDTEGSIIQQTSGRIAFLTNANLTVGNTYTPTERMRIDSAGNVGIGTTNPGVKLVIEESTSDVVTRYRANNNYAGQIIGKTSGVFSLNGRLGLDFNLTGDQTSAMYITSTGNVGIGTTSPGAKLEVDCQMGAHSLDTDNFNQVGLLVRSSATAGSGAKGGSIAFTNVSGSGGKHASITAVQTDDDSNNIGLAFEVHQDGTSGDPLIEAMRIDRNGNVGIGTTNPGTHKLNVNGTTFCTSASWSGSDDRIKHNEQPIIGALETLSKITPKKYIKTTEMYDADHDFELDTDGNPVDSNGEPVEHRIEAGVIAQQVLTVDELAFAVSPEGVDEDGTVTSPHGLDYNSLFTYAIAAIQEQQQLINDLKSRIETLEQQ